MCIIHVHYVHMYMYISLIDGIRRVSFKSLVERCLIVDYRHHPTMNDIIPSSPL